MGETVKISVFLPYYNDAVFLEQAINSVLQQTYKDFELILVNHASTDASRMIARSYGDQRIKHIDVSRNFGAVTGLNIKAFLGVAEGAYVKFQCADDILFPDALERLVRALKREPSAGLAFGNLRLVDAKLKPIAGDLDIFGVSEKWWPKEAVFNGIGDSAVFLKMIANGHCLLPYPGAIVRKDILDEIKIDASMIFLLDVSLWVECLLNGHKITFERDAIGAYRIHKKQTSAQSRKLEAIALEQEVLFDLFYHCNNLHLLKQTFSESPYALSCEHLDDMRFAVCEYFFRTRKSHCAYLELTKMLSDDHIRRRLQDKFNFSVYSLRDMYMHWSEAHKSAFKSWKAATKAKPGGEVGFWGLFWLLTDRIWKTVTLQSRRKRVR